MGKCSTVKVIIKKLKLKGNKLSLPVDRLENTVVVVGLPDHPWLGLSPFKGRGPRFNPLVRVL